jgi:hypothetical protein
MTVADGDTRLARPESFQRYLSQFTAAAQGTVRNAG